MTPPESQKISRDDLLREATFLHDELLGKEHCHRGKLHSCRELQMCIPQAADNLRKGRAQRDGNGTNLPRV